MIAVSDVETNKRAQQWLAQREMTSPSAAAMFVGDHMMASTSLAGAAAVFPACTATQCTSVTDRRTLASQHKREMYILHLMLTKNDQCKKLISGYDKFRDIFCKHLPSSGYFPFLVRNSSLVLFLFSTDNKLQCCDDLKLLIETMHLSCTVFRLQRIIC